MRHDDNTAPDEWTAADVTAGDSGEALRASERQLWRDFGRAPLGLVAASLIAGRRCVCLTANETYCELTGYTRRELGGDDFLSCFHPEDQPALEVLIQDVMSGATDQIAVDARLVRKDGGIVWTHLTGSVIRPPASERYLATFVEDITDAEQARAEIQQLQRELQRSRRLASLGQLVGGISHDFSNTLTVIANYASLIREDVIVAETTESAAKWGPVRWDVEQIEQAADGAKRLIKHLLAFARREEAEPVLVDLGQLISDATGLLGEVLGEHVPVVTRQVEGLWPVQADPSLLKQAIVNIALNARDAMPELGHGTTVTVVLPVAAGSQWPTAEHQGRAMEPAGTVLVIDDEAAIREVAHRVLTSAGYRVVTAVNGHEALRLLGDPEMTADLVLTDVVMPGMTGAAFAAQAHASRPDLPVLFMSGYEPQGAAAEGWPDPGAQVISKPFSRAALLARVTQMLTADTDASAGQQPGQRTRTGRR